MKHKKIIFTIFLFLFSLFAFIPLKAENNLSKPLYIDNGISNNQPDRQNENSSDNSVSQKETVIARNDKDIENFINSRSPNSVFNFNFITENFLGERRQKIVVNEYSQPIQNSKTVKIRILDSRTLLSFYQFSKLGRNFYSAFTEFFEYSLTIPSDYYTIFNFLGVEEIYIATKLNLVNSGYDSENSRENSTIKDFTALDLMNISGTNVSKNEELETYFSDDGAKKIIKKDNRMFIGAGYLGKLPVIPSVSKFFDQTNKKFSTELFGLKKIYRYESDSQLQDISSMFQTKEKNRLLEYINYFNKLYSYDFSYDFTNALLNEYKEKQDWNYISNSNYGVFPISNRLEENPTHEQNYNQIYGKEILNRNNFNSSISERDLFLNAVEQIRQIPFFSENIFYYIGDNLLYRLNFTSYYSDYLISAFYRGEVKLKFKKNKIQISFQNKIRSLVIYENSEIKKYIFKRLENVFYTTNLSEIIKEINYSQAGYKIDNLHNKNISINSVAFNFTPISAIKKDPTFLITFSSINDYNNTTEYFFTRNYFESIRNTIVYYYLGLQKNSNPVYKINEIGDYYVFGLRIFPEINSKLKEIQNYDFQNRNVNLKTEIDTRVLEIIKEYVDSVKKNKELFIKESDFITFFYQALDFQNSKTNRKNFLYEDIYFTKYSIQNQSQIGRDILYTLLKKMNIENLNGSNLVGGFENVRFELKEENSQKFLQLTYSFTSNSQKYYIFKVDVSKYLYKNVEELYTKLNSSIKKHTTNNDRLFVENDKTQLQKFLTNSNNNQRLEIEEYFFVKNNNDNILKEFLVFDNNFLKSITKTFIPFDYRYKGNNTIQSFYEYFNFLKQNYIKISNSQEQQNFLRENIHLKLKINLRDFNSTFLRNGNVKTLPKKNINLTFSLNDFIQSTEQDFYTFLFNLIEQKLKENFTFTIKTLGSDSLVFLLKDFEIILHTFKNYTNAEDIRMLEAGNLENFNQFIGNLFNQETQPFIFSGTSFKILGNPTYKQHLVYAYVDILSGLVVYTKDLSYFNNTINNSYVLEFYKKYFKKDTLQDFITQSYQDKKVKIIEIIDKNVGYNELTEEEKEYITVDKTFYNLLSKVIKEIVNDNNNLIQINNIYKSLTKNNVLEQHLPIFILKNTALLKGYNYLPDTVNNLDLNDFQTLEKNNNVDIYTFKTHISYSFNFNIKIIDKEQTQTQEKDFLINVNLANNDFLGSATISEFSKNLQFSITNLDPNIDIENFYNNLFFVFEKEQKTYFLKVEKQEENYVLKYVVFKLNSNNKIEQDYKNLDFIKDNLINTLDKQIKKIVLILNDKRIIINLLNYVIPSLDFVSNATSKIVDNETIKTNILTIIPNNRTVENPRLFEEQEQEQEDIKTKKRQNREKFIIYDSSNQLNKNKAFLLGLQIVNENSKLIDINGNETFINYYEFFLNAQLNANYETYFTSNEVLLKLKNLNYTNNEYELAENATNELENWLKTNYNFEKYKNDYQIYSQFFNQTIEKEGTYTFIYYYFSYGKIHRVKSVKNIIYKGRLLISSIIEKQNSETFYKKRTFYEKNKFSLDNYLNNQVFENDITINFGLYDNQHNYITDKILNNFSILKNTNDENYEINKETVGYLGFIIKNNKKILIENESQFLEYIITTLEETDEKIEFILYKVRPYKQDDEIKYFVIDTIIKNFNIRINKRNSVIKIDNGTNNIQKDFKNKLITNNFINEQDLDIDFYLSNEKQDLENLFLRINVYEYNLDKDIKTNIQLSLERAINSKPIVINLKALKEEQENIENLKLVHILNKIIIGNKTLPNLIEITPTKKYLIVYEIINIKDKQQDIDYVEILSKIQKNKSLGGEILKDQQRANAFVYFKDNTIEIKKEKDLYIDTIENIENIYLRKNTQIVFEKEFSINAFLLPDFDKNSINKLKNGLIELLALQRQDTIKKIKENSSLQINLENITLNAKELVVNKNNFNHTILFKNLDFIQNPIQLLLVIDNFNNIKFYNIVYIDKKLTIDFSGIKTDITSQLIEEVITTKHIISEKDKEKDKPSIITLKTILNSSHKYFIDYIDYKGGLFKGVLKDFIFSITKNGYEKDFIKNFELSILKYSYSGISFNEVEYIENWLKLQINNNFFKSITKENEQETYSSEILLQELKQNLRERNISFEEENFTIFDYYKEILTFTLVNGVKYYKDQLIAQQNDFDLNYKYFNEFKEFIKNLSVVGNKNQYLDLVYKNFIVNNFNFDKEVIYFNEFKDNQFLNSFNFLQEEFTRYNFNNQKQNKIKEFLKERKDNKIFLYFDIETKSGFITRYFIELVNDEELNVLANYNKEVNKQIINIENEKVYNIQNDIEKPFKYTINENTFTLTQEQKDSLNALLSENNLKTLEELEQFGQQEIEVVNQFLNNPLLYKKYQGENIIDLDADIKDLGVLKKKYIVSNSSVSIKTLDEEIITVYYNEIVDIVDKRQEDKNITTLKYKENDFVKKVLSGNTKTINFNETGYYRVIIIDKRGNKQDFLVLITNKDGFELKIQDNLIIISNKETNIVNEERQINEGYYFEKQEDKIVLNTRYNPEFIFKKESQNKKYIDKIEIRYDALSGVFEPKESDSNAIIGQSQQNKYIYKTQKGEALENKTLEKNGYYEVEIVYNKLSLKYLGKTNLILYVFKDNLSPNIEIGNKKIQEVYKNRNRLTNNKDNFSEKEQGFYAKGINENDYILGFRLKDNYNKINKLVIKKQTDEGFVDIKVFRENEITYTQLETSSYFNLILYSKQEQNLGLLNTLYQNDFEIKGFYKILVYDKVYNKLEYSFNFNVITYQDTFNFVKENKELFINSLKNPYGSEIIVKEENDNNEFVLYKTYYNEEYLDFNRFGNNNYQIEIKDSFNNTDIIEITINDGIMIELYNKENVLYNYEKLKTKTFVPEEYKTIIENTEDKQEKERLKKQYETTISNDFVYFENLGKLNETNAPEFGQGLVVFNKERTYFTFKKGVKNVRYSFISFESEVESIGESEEEKVKVSKDNKGEFLVRHNNNGILKIEFESVFNKGITYKIYSVLLNKQQMQITLSYDMFSVFENNKETKINPLLELLYENEVDFDNMGKLKLTFDNTGLIGAYYNQINLLEKERNITKNQILQIQNYFNTNKEYKEKLGVQIYLENYDIDKLIAFNLDENRILPKTEQVKKVYEKYNSYYKGLKDYLKSSNLAVVENQDYITKFKTLHNFINTNSNYTEIKKLKKISVSKGKIEYKKDTLISNRPFYIKVLENKEKIQNTKTYEYKTYTTKSKVLKEDKEIINLKKNNILVSYFDKKEGKYIIDLYKNFKHNTRDNIVKLEIFNFDNSKDKFIEQENFTIKYRPNSFVYLIVIVGVIIFVILSVITIILIIRKNRV